VTPNVVLITRSLFADIMKRQRLLVIVVYLLIFYRLMLMPFLVMKLKVDYGLALADSLKECVFVNSALKIECHVVKITPLQTAFSEIGVGQILSYDTLI